MPVPEEGASGVPHKLVPKPLRCAFCDKRANPDDPDLYREVLSWVHGPKLDGPVLRERTGKVAHKDCVDKLRAGQAPDQEELF